MSLWNGKVVNSGIVEKPTHTDILFGRGVGTNRHEGNTYFRDVVAKWVVSSYICAKALFDSQRYVGRSMNIKTAATRISNNSLLLSRHHHHHQKVYAKCTKTKKMEISRGIVEHLAGSSKKTL